MTYNTHRNTIVAVLAVFISLAAVVAPSVQLEAAEDSTYFTWTLNYDYSQMNVRDGQPLTYGEGMDGMVPITNTRTSVGTVTNIGSWDFDTNPLLKLCYYAVFDPSTGDCLGRLDTDNLARYEDGTSAASDIKTNNVLFCIPTIYWKSTDTTLTISNDPDSGGVAYAHTIDGRVYDYLGIGVYEASYDGTYLLSASGAMPDEGSIGPSLAQVADRTIVADGDANLWNLYQWNLYRYICFFAMESFDSDSFGFGDAGASTTGVTDSMGPYAGSTSYSNNGPVKFFIERAWGGVGEILGDTYFTTDWTIVAGQNSTPGWGTSDKEVVCDGPGFSNGYISTIWTDAKAWGLPDGNSGNWYNGMHDYVWGGYAQILDAVIVGGGYAKAGGGYEMGINCLDLSTAMNTGADSIGSRISYVFDSSSVNVTFMDGDTTVSTITVAAGSTVVAPPAPTKTDYVFAGWFTSPTDGTRWDFSQTVSSNMTLYAHWVEKLVFTTDPTANVQAKAVMGSPGTVAFDATTSEDYISVLWDFGDGHISSEPVITHYYTQPGTYTAMLTVYNQNGTDSIEYLIEVPGIAAGGGGE